MPPRDIRGRAEPSRPEALRPCEMRAMPESHPTRSNPDAAIDAALDAATSKAPASPAAELPLKKQWDDDLEAELEAALEGFDAENYEVSDPAGRGRPTGPTSPRARGARRRAPA